MINRKQEPIAIIGISCRFPGDVNNTEEFWKLLIENKDAVKRIPKDRWNPNDFFHTDISRIGVINQKKGGFLKDIDKFDSNFFGIPPIRAVNIDPQQRIILETVYNALEDAGIKLEDISGTNTSVFVGNSSFDYAGIHLSNVYRRYIKENMVEGIAASVLSNRISYFFNLQGPSVSIDTACSSSLYAADLGCKSIWNKESKMSIVAGVNIILKPELHMGFAKGGFLSPDSKCKAFSKDADGYVRSEGCGVIILKRLSKAIKDKDNIYALIRATLTSQDGHTKSLVMPNFNAQKDLLEKMYKKMSINTNQVGYIEAHGTGTKLGDTIEAKAIGEVIGGKRPDNDNPCIIGSVKTNMGHLEAASGIAGLIKSALVLKNQTIPANLHFKEPNPEINFKDLNIKVLNKNKKYNINKKIKYAGVNSFSFAGSNAHVILEEPPRLKNSNNNIQKKDQYIFILSAKSKTSLNSLVKKYIEYISVTKHSLRDISYSTCSKRTLFDKHLILISSSKYELKKKLLKYINNGSIDVDFNTEIKKPKIAFVYSGQGTQWWGMARQLLEEEPVFIKTIKQIDDILEKNGWLPDTSLINELSKSEKDSNINNTVIAQNAIFAVQAGITNLLKSKGLSPYAVIGHSVGELASAYISGSLSLKEALRVMYVKSSLQKKQIGKGSMLVTGMNEEDAKEIISSYKGKLEIAAINAKESVTISGDSKAVSLLEKKLKRKDIFHRRLKVEAGFHSYFMDEIKDDFIKSAGNISTSKNNIALYSTVTGSKIVGTELKKDYWFDNMRQPVKFYHGIKSMIDNGYNIFIEIGAHPIFQGVINSVFNEFKKEGVILFTLKRNENDLLNISRLFTFFCINKFNFNWKKVFDNNADFVKLPYYEWERDGYPITNPEPEFMYSKIHPHIKSYSCSVRNVNISIWDITLDKSSYNYIKEHRIDGLLVYPGSGIVDLFLTIAKINFGHKLKFLENIELKKPIILSKGDELPLVRCEIISNDNKMYIYSK
ncbi:beta-ketoacyl synthase N-terminal-like domain-containing protein, partial [bacterium]